MTPRERDPDPHPPVCIYTLGRAETKLRGQPLHFSGKGQRRPLLLLQHLLARNGRPAPTSLLRQALADDDGLDEAPLSRGAFDMALSRLRRVLNVPDLLQLEDGQLRLNPALCWVDAWACEAALMRADHASDPDQGLALLDSALELYEGDFLPGADAPWTLLARERLRSRLLRVARRIGQGLEQAGRGEEARNLYERLHELFPLDEELCLRLIRGHLRRNEYGQAVGLRARCRELLAKVLGVLPSPAIEALFASARAG